MVNDQWTPNMANSTPMTLKPRHLFHPLWGQPVISHLLPILAKALIRPPHLLPRIAEFTEPLRQMWSIRMACRLRPTFWTLLWPPPFRLVALLTEAPSIVRTLWMAGGSRTLHSHRRASDRNTLNTSIPMRKPATKSPIRTPYHPDAGPRSCSPRPSPSRSSTTRRAGGTP